MRLLLTETLVEAFTDDPAFVVLFPRDRAAALTDWFTAVIDVLGSCERARMLTVGQAAAIWTIGPCQSCSCALDDRLFNVINDRSGSAGVTVAAALSEAALLAPPQAWFLHWIGTPDAHRREGHGRRLLTGILRMATEAGEPLWTTTSNPGAVRFYTGLGMSVLAEVRVPGIEDLTCWTLRTPIG